jgi:FAD:protein FMN transferase
VSVATQVIERFPCFGAQCEIHVLDDGDAVAAVRAVRALLQAWHARFTRFETTSELSRLNADPATEVAVSAPMARFALAAREAAERTGGLVDPTLLRPLEALGYRGDLRGSVPLGLALGLAPTRRPAAPDPANRWRELAIDASRRTVARPPGLALDSGGIVKGLAADMLAKRLSDCASFAIDCAGDLRIGGASGDVRRTDVVRPFDGRVLHTYELADAGIATSGIGRRSWLDPSGRPAHHLLDPSTGRPAFTGIVQATAVAPTALEAEVCAKAALLSGPEGAAAHLPGGGVLVLDSGDHVVVPPTAARYPPATS